ncbi:MAG: hypothetical protein VXW58_08980 [Pseudomonadota bacterium]|nr:hypothetical protein [Pseudomonadota bacterium]
MLKAFLKLAVVSLACAPVAATAWTADNRLDVNPLPGGGFEVIGDPGSGGPDYWCAAGDYALRVLGARATDRVYITRGRGAPETSTRKSGVQFSLTAPADVPDGLHLFLKMRRVGDNLAVTFARNYCLDNKDLGI